VSLELIDNEIRRFLATSEPEALCISGRWGVGKTFAWKRYFTDAQAKGEIALKRYSYVSLFGINSLDDLKYSIFENSVKALDKGAEPSLETLTSHAVAAAEQLGRKSLWFLQQLPRVRNYVGNLGPAWFLTVKETIVCVDDIERRGNNLSAREVMGLISTLKEHRKCKVALIWNDDAPDKDQEEFRRYYEKVVDVSLRFAPSAQECARIALPGNRLTDKLLAENVVMLGINNIRLIKRIERAVQQISTLVSELDQQILKQAIHSLTLLGWSLYEPSNAPSLDYLQKTRGKDYFGGEKGRAVPEKEASWNALLDAYRFRGMDEFDLVLLQGVRDGFFDAPTVKKHASALNTQIKAGDLLEVFFQAWQTYHDSFDDNQEEVLDGLHGAFLKGVRYITPPNLNGTVALFKALGRQRQAVEMIAHYVETRADERALFDLRTYPFAGDVTDPDIVQAFRDQHVSFKTEINPTAILLRMAETNGWNPEDIVTLSTLPVGEYYKIFKNNRGHDLRRLVDTCLQFGRIMSASPDMREISKRAKDALALVGKESAINARRVKAYGVEVNDGDTGNSNEPQSR
jgi:hypothetical protein